MKFPTLYKKGKKNEIRMWSLSTQGDSIITVHGIHKGKTQTAEKKVKGKSIGKKNETTPEQQADMDAQSMWKKKKDKGYFESIHDAQTEIVFLPMLACELKKGKEDKLPSSFFIQPKMDGVRCLARWDGDRIQLLSRGGKEYSVAHLSKELEGIIQPDQVLDGEIYIHNTFRQDINKLVKKHRPKPVEGIGYRSADLQYWVYDSFYTDRLNETFRERKGLLSYIPYDGKIVRRVYVEPIKVDMLKGRHKNYIRKGFEGTIIRLHEGTYELGHRSRSLLKYKDFQDAEYEVVGFGEGVGKFEGCVIWTCQTEIGQSFNVNPKGTLAQKRQWFKEANKYIGKKLTVKYQDLSKDGIPNFPVGLDFRLEKDMP